MSQLPTTARRPSNPPRTKRRSFSGLTAPAGIGGATPALRRRATGTVQALTAPKAQRTSKTSQKLVLLPSAPQTKPLPRVNEHGFNEEEGDDELGYETDAGVRVRDYKNQGERMSKSERKKAGFRRITAYCIAEALKMKLLAGFLKREHNVVPRIYDEAVYVMYQLPLLPGYGPNVNVRSSAFSESTDNHKIIRRMSEAENTGYDGTYFNSTSQDALLDPQGYIPSSSPQQARAIPVGISDTEGETSDHDLVVRSASEVELASSPETIRTPALASAYTQVSFSQSAPVLHEPPVSAASQGTFTPDVEDEASRQESQGDDVAEAIFFDYGVVVFFGFSEGEERGILDDIENAGILRRKIKEDDWEVEECHYVHDPNIAYPRIYNDFFTLRSHSHLLKLSIAHALAQSTLLAHYETNSRAVLSSPETVAIPRQLAESGKLTLRRRDALKLTGRLFKLRRDVNLVSNVLDVPELFWSEASLKDLYDAVREYMEIGSRVEALNEKIGVASDLLDAIHDHLNNSAMERITWIIIWLIVAAILVELGEVIARLIVHATTRNSSAKVLVKTAAEKIANSTSGSVVSKQEVLRILERMMEQS
ncbi:DUF155-domain-containing protein [Punctularia strigosozonata HHB-11173 SS5]|uniref:DUF155-domain-containing protein n=1 Tax=Punctularia strigosozonata (strain HHB-11173) TaxID=741275 RepID=UPI0004417F7A|nr:DUF155-domain-containing protein [Punctularia strigosozonata HHB-11173 SS5]EIN08273.1 DUF155-domain-containing protein [Punctularia strigosozonata HHB-11173 SS5]